MDFSHPSVSLGIEELSTEIGALNFSQLQEEVTEHARIQLWIQRLLQIPMFRL